MNKKAALAVCLLVSITFSSCFIRCNFVQAQFLGSVTINADGSVTGTNNIHRDGDIYTLTGNISGGIQIQKSNIILDGAGYAVEGAGEGNGVDLSNGRGQDPTRPEVSNVTIKNLKILNFYYGVDNANTNSNIFIENRIENCTNSLWIIGSYNNLIVNSTLINAPIAINYAGQSNITRNDFVNCSVMVWLSTEPFVDGNYWSDYQERYPDAKEVNNTGVWDTPYEYSTGNFDIHPQAKPVTYLLDNAPVDTQPSPTDTNSRLSPTVTIIAVACGVTVAVVGIGIFLFFNKNAAGSQKTHE